MWNRKELKQKGKAAFLANYWKTVLVAILMTALVLGSVSYSSSTVRHKLDNPDQTAETPVDVYGPPMTEETESELPEDYEPSENVPEAVYGPPEDLGWD